MHHITLKKMFEMLDLTTKNETEQKKKIQRKQIKSKKKKIQLKDRWGMGEIYLLSF